MSPVSANTFVPSARTSFRVSYTLIGEVTNLESVGVAASYGDARGAFKCKESRCCSTDSTARALKIKANFQPTCYKNDFAGEATRHSPAARIIAVRAAAGYIPHHHTLRVLLEFRP